MATVTLTIPDIMCGHCELTVTKALGSLEGVRSVSVDIPTKQMQVEYDDTSAGVEQMREALAAEDYPVASVSGGDSPARSPGPSHGGGGCTCSGVG